MALLRKERLLVYGWRDGGEERERGKETKRQRETATEDRKRKDGKKDKMEKGRSNQCSNIPIKGMSPMR